MKETYYSVRIPYEANPADQTQWHPRNATGPFSVLDRGAFAAYEEAVEWAESESIKNFTVIATEVES